MGNVRETNPLSSFTLLFLANQIALLAIAIYGQSVAAAVFFWLGIAFLLSRMEPINMRYCGLLFWVGITFALLGYIVVPDVETSNLLEISNLKFWFGSLLYLIAAVVIGGTVYKVFTLPPST